MPNAFKNLFQVVWFAPAQNLDKQQDGYKPILEIFIKKLVNGYKRQKMKGNRSIAKYDSRVLIITSKRYKN